MDLNRLFLFNLLSRKRMFIAFVGFFLSSIIFSGANVLLTSMIASSQSYLGETDDILVISDITASTPFTGHLPIDLASATKRVSGVVAVSPEVMTATVYKGRAVYVRGIDPAIFWNLTSFKSLEGILVGLNDNYDVTIGINFAEREGLTIGSYFTIFSTIHNTVLELRVKSIIRTDTLLDDEIIAPLWTGQFLAFKKYDFITHLRVKIDPTITTKDRVRELVTSSFDLTVLLETYNSSLTHFNASLSIRTINGKEIVNRFFINNNSIIQHLPFREYELIVEYEGYYSENYQLILGSDKTQSVFVPYLQRIVNFSTVNDLNQSISGVTIDIETFVDPSDSLTPIKSYSLTTDEYGFASVILPNGSYVANISYSDISFREHFTTLSSNNFSIVVDFIHPTLDINFLSNNSLIVGGEIAFLATSSPSYDIFYYLF